MLSKFSRLMAATALAFGFTAANAALTSHDFSVQWNDGIDAGTTSKGSLVFDDAISASSFTWDQLAGFSFDFRGTTIGLSGVLDENKSYLTNQVKSILSGGTGDALTFTFHQAETFSYYSVAAGSPSTFDLPYSSGNWQLTSPVPEPGPLAMLLCGTAVMGGMAARRRKTQN